MSNHLITESNQQKQLQRQKQRNKDVIQTENNIWQEEISAKPKMSEANKSPLKKESSRVIQPIETKNRYSLLETEENRTENRNTRNDSPTQK